MAILQRRRRGAAHDGATGATSAGNARRAEAGSAGDNGGGARRRRRARRADRAATRPAPTAVAPPESVRARPAFSLRDSWPVLLVRAAHPKQGLLTAAGLATAAALTDRTRPEVLVVFLAVLVGQTILGWHNDLVDRKRDARHQTPGKPIAEGKLDPGLVWFAVAVAVAALVPLSIATGTTAGGCLLLAVAIGAIGNAAPALRRHALSWLTWVLQFALYAAYLSFGGWGGAAEGTAPDPAMAVLAAMLGLGVHFLRATFGLVADHEDGWTYLPLKLGLKLGATRLLVLSATYTVLVLVGMAIVGATVGLST